MESYSLISHSANDEILATKITYAMSKYDAILEPTDKSLIWRWSSIIKGICEPYPITIAYHMPLQHVLDLFQFDLGIKIVHISEDEHFYPQKIIAQREIRKGQSVVDTEAELILNESIHKARVTYLSLINRGVDPQVASLCLPQSIYVDCHLSGDIHTWSSFFLALKEDRSEWSYIKKHGASIQKLINEVYPLTMKVLRHD
jgi:hypothetical protein